MAKREVDVVVIGSGIGGLCCGSLLARYGYGVLVCESHSIPGGAAHSFERQGYTFDSGPSLYSGLSYSPSPNPLRQVLDALGVELPCVTYDTWGCYLPEAEFETAVGADQFCTILKQVQGETAVQQWRQLQAEMKPLAAAATALPPAALRLDWGAILTTGRFAPAMLPHILNVSRLTGPFSTVLNDVVTDPFIKNWMNLLCFLLSGIPADGTSTAEIAFMFADWYRPGVKLDYPVGGSGGLVRALVKGLERWGGSLQLNAHVDEIIVRNQQVQGVRLRDGETIRARRAVVSNTSSWDTLRLLPNEAVSQTFRMERQQMPLCDSFMHLHLGIRGDNLPSGLPCHAIVVNHWGLTDPQNVVLISIPSVLDPGLAPPGHHVIHAYTPATEPYELWQSLDRRGKAYQAFKQERSEVLWQALERCIPDIRSRCEVTLIGTPLTHERFLRRYRGSYGPAIRAGEAMFPGSLTPLKGLVCCGDCTFPGIGLPAVAASGLITANTLASVSDHLNLMTELGLTV